MDNAKKVKADKRPDTCPISMEKTIKRKCSLCIFYGEKCKKWW